MLKRLGMLLLFFALPVAVAAHPHVFVENEICFVFDEKGLAGIELQWFFDEMFSAGIIMDYDSNGDGAFSAAEQAVIRCEAFDNLKNYDYFSQVSIDGKPFKVQFVRDFKAAIREGQLVYTFLIPCHVSALTSAKEVRIAVFDPEYYTQIDSGAVRLKAAAKYLTTTKMIRNPDLAYYNRLIIPDEVILNFRSKQ